LGCTSVAFLAPLVNPINSPVTVEAELKQAQGASHTLGLQAIHVLQASTERDLALSVRPWCPVRTWFQSNIRTTSPLWQKPAYGFVMQLTSSTIAGRPFLGTGALPADTNMKSSHGRSADS